MAGFEPAASCSQSRRANQAAPHPADRSVAYRPACYLLGRSRSRLRAPGSRHPAGRPFACRGVSALGPLAGTLSVLTWRGSGLHAGNAGVAQWQSPSLPSWSWGFDSPRPLQPIAPGQPPSVGQHRNHYEARAACPDHTWARGRTSRILAPLVQVVASRRAHLQSDSSSWAGSWPTTGAPSEPGTSAAPSWTARIRAIR
jgi:hypothetical protein